MAGAGQCGQAGLQLQQRRQGVHFRRVAGIGEHRLHLAPQRRGQRHPPAHPLGHYSAAALGDAHVGGHVFQPHQFQQAPGELEAVAALEATDELFFHRAQPAAAQELHAHAAIAGDGADRQAMPQRHAPVGDAVDAGVVAHHLVEIGVVRERAAALHDEVEHGLPGGLIECGEGIGTADFAQQRIGLETAAQCQGHAMLG